MQNHLTKVMLGATLGLSILISGVAAAQPGTRDPGVNHRQYHQSQRIGQGVRSGELTRSEAQSLRQGRRDIRQQEHAYKADGVMTGAERRDLHQDLNAQSRAIYQDKHNDETRNP
jgi:hypothetical protein